MDFRIFCCSFVPRSWKWNFRSDQWRIGSSLHSACAPLQRTPSCIQQRTEISVHDNRCVYKSYNLKVHYFVNFFVPFKFFLNTCMWRGKPVFLLLKDFCTSQEQDQECNKCAQTLVKATRLLLPPLSHAFRKETEPHMCLQHFLFPFNICIVKIGPWLL